MERNDLDADQNTHPQADFRQYESVEKRLADSAEVESAKFNDRPSNLNENIHDMAIIEDPRFEGTTCDLSDSLGLKSQIKNSVGDFSFFAKKSGNQKSKSPMIENVFNTKNEIEELTEDDIIDYNFLQNYLELINNQEFFVDDFMTEENLINHIIYQLKQYFRKRSFDPSSLMDSLKEQLLELSQEQNDSKSNLYKQNAMLSFHHGFEDHSKHKKKDSFIDFAGNGVRKLSNQKYIFEEPRWFLIKVIFLVAFLSKDKRSSIGGSHPSTGQAHKIFTEGFDFSDPSTLKPNFVIPSVTILAEVLSRLQSYNSSINVDGCFSKDGLFNKIDDYSPGMRLDSHENDQAEVLSISERISMLEKFKGDYDSQASESNNSDDDQPDMPFNIMKFSQKLRESRVSERESRAIIDKTAENNSGYKSARDKYQDSGRRQKSSAAKLRDFQRQRSRSNFRSSYIGGEYMKTPDSKHNGAKSPTPGQEYFAVCTEESMTENNSCLKDQLFVAKKENTALMSLIKTLEDQLVDVKEEKDDYESLYNNANKESSKLERRIDQLNALKNEHKQLIAKYETSEEKVMELSKTVEGLLNQLRDAHNMIQKFTKQMEDKDVFMEQTIKAQETIIDELNSTHKQEVKKLKQSFQQQQEFVYAMQDYKSRTSEINNCNGCDVDTQTDTLKPIDQVNCEVQTSPSEEVISGAKPPIGPTSTNTKSKSVQVNVLHFANPKIDQKCNSEKQESVGTSCDFTQNDENHEIVMHKVEKLKSKYKSLKMEYQTQYEIKSKYHKLYKECHSLLKSVLYKYNNLKKKVGAETSSDYDISEC